MQDATNETTRHDSLTVVKIADMRLMLLHHWSLYDSLVYSGYTASRMQVWRASWGRNAVVPARRSVGIMAGCAE